MGLDRHDVEP